jgi:hypothetical protein
MRDPSRQRGTRESSRWPPRSTSPAQGSLRRAPRRIAPGAETWRSCTAPAPSITDGRVKGGAPISWSEANNGAGALYPLAATAAAFGAPGASCPREVREEQHRPEVRGNARMHPKLSIRGDERGQHLVGKATLREAPGHLCGGDSGPAAGLLEMPAACHRLDPRLTRTCWAIWIRRPP